MTNRKVCGDLNTRILRCGNAFAMKRICVFDDGKIRIWQRKNTGTMNRSPTPGGVFVGNFVRHICDLLCPECT